MRTTPIARRALHWLCTGLLGLALFPRSSMAQQRSDLELPDRLLNLNARGPRWDGPVEAAACSAPDDALSSARCRCCAPLLPLLGHGLSQDERTKLLKRLAVVPLPESVPALTELAEKSKDGDLINVAMALAFQKAPNARVVLKRASGFHLPE